MPAYTFPVNRYLNSNISEKTDYVRNYSRNDDNNTINAYTTYHLQLGQANQHDFKFMLGMNLVTGKWSSYTVRKNSLIVPSNPQFDLAIGEQFADGSRNWSGRLGFFGRLNYAYSNRYFLEANLRRDGSTSSDGTAMEMVPVLLGRLDLHERVLYGACETGAQFR